MNRDELFITYSDENSFLDKLEFDVFRAFLRLSWTSLAQPLQWQKSLLHALEFKNPSMTQAWCHELLRHDEPDSTSRIWLYHSPDDLWLKTTLLNLLQQDRKDANKAIIIAAANDNISCTMLQDHITKHAKVKSEYTAIHGQYQTPWTCQQSDKITAANAAFQHKGRGPPECVNCHEHTYEHSASCYPSPTCGTLRSNNCQWQSTRSSLRNHSPQDPLQGQF